MSKIECYSNWCYIDRLDGINLVDGERLEVTFPSGETLQVTCKIIDQSYDEMEMGRPTRIPVHRAYIQTKWKGQPCNVSLTGLEAKRIAKKGP